MSELLGKETIDSFNTTESKGQSPSHGLNYQKLGKDLMSQDEIAVMDGGKCICQIRGLRPFLSAKHDITKHPHYKYLSDHDKKNTFNVEMYLARMRKPKPPVGFNEPFYFIELEDEPGDIAEPVDADAIGEIEAEPA